MTAASGVVHEEFHGREFARRGGTFEMVQLWVNLPAKDKMAPPALPEHPERRDPGRRAWRTGGHGARHRRRARGLHGSGADLHADPRLGPAPRAGAASSLALPDGYTTALVVLHGERCA